MEVLAPAAAAAFVAVPAILALYILKVRGLRSPVGALRLWPGHLADRQANAPWKRLRTSWLLLVQLLVAAAVALALMRPGLVGAAGAAGTTVVLLDGSASMQATDVKPSRFEAAVAKARARADRLAGDQQMAVVLLGPQAQLLASPTADPAVLRSALNRARPSGEAANLQEGLSLANAVLAGRPGGSVVLYSDGHTRRPDSPLPLSAPLRYEGMGASGDNASVAILGRSPNGEMVIRVANLGASARDLSVELRTDGRLADVVPVRVEGRSSTDIDWGGLPDGAKLLEARLSPTDDLRLDDAAWLITEAPQPRRVLLVTPGNDFVARALRLRDDLDVTVVDPAAYRGGDFDLYVFDGFVPDGPLPAPALVIGPPEGKGPVAAGPLLDPGELVPPDPREPLLQYLSLRDVHVQSAASANPPPDWRVVVAAANAPLLLVHQGEPRIAQLTFDVHRSDLPLRAAFPILIQNLVSELVPGGFENQTLPLGRPVSLTADPATTALEIALPGGRQLELPPPYPAVLTDTNTPGVYTVRERRPGEVSTSRFSVALADPEQSRIAPGPRPQVEVTTRPGAPAPRGTLEIWPWLAALVFAGLVLEWFVFLRG